MCGTYASSFCFSDDLYQIASPNGGARLLFTEVDSGCGIYKLVAQLDRYGDLTAIYGRDGKKLRGFAYRNHIMVDYRHKCDSVYEIYKKD